jgi:uncharacterized protein
MFVALPCQVRAEPYSFPKQKPLVFANQLNIDPTPSSAASFDCDHARSAIEKLICSHLSLARADGDLDFSYRLLLHWSAPSARQVIRDQQGAWLRRRDACPDDECLSKVYDDRDSELRQQVRAAELSRTRYVAKLGACQVTRIEMIGGRLWAVEGQKPDGMSFFTPTE